MGVLDKVELDFQMIQTYDPRILSVFDMSVWGAIDSKPSIIEIIMPGECEPVVHYFNKREINIFNSVNLGLNCVGCDEPELLNLPDGIYEITIKGSPDTFNKTRKILRTEELDLDTDVLFIQANVGCKDENVDLLKELDRIRILKRAAEANVRYDLICKAQELMFKAQDIMKNLKDCNKCADV